MFRALFTTGAAFARSQRGQKLFMKATPIATGLVGAAAMGNFALCASKKQDYDQVKDAIVAVMDENEGCGPILVRLAWHASGTFDAKQKNGGASKATMRFAPEKDDPANNGLEIARKFLEPVKKQFPWLSYGDLWTLAGCVAIEEMGGPSIQWHSGRTDGTAKDCPPAGRLPDGAKKQDHVRDVFYRMGFNDREIVALIGAHALGRCHKDRSGFDGPWTRAETTFSNMYFQELMNNEWHVRKWDGPKQYADPTGDLMMLPADMSIREDPVFAKYAAVFAIDEDLFFSEFAKAFGKLLELGWQK